MQPAAPSVLPDAATAAAMERESPSNQPSPAPAFKQGIRMRSGFSSATDLDVANSEQMRHASAHGGGGGLMAASVAFSGQDTVAASFGSASHAGVTRSEFAPEEGIKATHTQLQLPISMDPDYEPPRGIMTETEVYLRVCKDERYDCYGFRLPATASDPQQQASTSGASGGGRGGSRLEQRHAGSGSARPAPGSVEEWRQARRLRKWARMLGPDGRGLGPYMQRKFGKLKRRVRKGVPQQFRGLAWHLLSGGHALMNSNAPGTYQALQLKQQEQQAQQQPNTPDYDADIMRDLNRTFPTNVYFTERQGPGQLALYNVLRAYCAYNKQVGYVQGMGNVVAVLLLHMPEEQAFWSFAALMKGANQPPPQPPLEAAFSEGMPGLKLGMHQWQALLEAKLPALAAHMKAQGVEPILYSTHWFNTLFAYSLPFDHLLRIWDVYMLEGVKVVFRVALALVGLTEQRLLKCKFEQLADALGAKGLHRLLPDKPDDLMKAALKLPVSATLSKALADWKSKGGK